MGAPLAVLAVLGTVVQAVGSVQQARAQKKAYSAQAAIVEQQNAVAQQEAEIQASQAARDAAEARAVGEERAGKVRTAAAREKSQARAALAASGVMTSTGSALTIEEYIGAAGESDAAAEVTEGARRGRYFAEHGQYLGRQAAYGSASAGAQTRYYRQAGSNAYSSGLISAGTTLLGGYSAYSRAAPGWKTNVGPGTYGGMYEWIG